MLGSGTMLTVRRRNKAELEQHTDGFYRTMSPSPLAYFGKDLRIPSPKSSRYALARPQGGPVVNCSLGFGTSGLVALARDARRALHRRDAEN
jgi:hypothetical protein